MIIKKDIDKDSIIEILSEYKWIRWTVYAAGAVVSIWILGKGAKLIADAVANFKQLNHAIKC